MKKSFFQKLEVCACHLYFILTMIKNVKVSLNEVNSLIISEPYLLWMEREVFPYIFGISCLLTIILGLLFNIAICKLWANEDHIGIKLIIYKFVAIDVFSDVFVLVPGVYLSLSSTEDLTYSYCVINGIVSLMTFSIHFGILSMGLVSSIVKLAKTEVKEAPTRMCRHFCFVTCVCFGSCILVSVPITWNDGYVYRTMEYQCGPNRSFQKAYIHIVFSVSVFLSLCLTLIVSVMLMKKFLSQNTKVSALTHAQSAETIIMEDQTRSTVMRQEEGFDHKPSTFKSHVTVSFEDQTKSYNRHQECELNESNRFKSYVTVSMEDQTKSYERIPFRDPRSSGVTISMEDQTTTNIRRFKLSVTDSESSLGISNFGMSIDRKADSLPDIISSGGSVWTDSNILNRNMSKCTLESFKYYETSAYETSPNLRDAGCQNFEPKLDKDANDEIESITSSDNEISFDGSCGSGILSRAASRSSSPTSVRNDTRRLKASIKSSSLPRNVNKGLFTQLLQSSLSKNYTFKFAAIYTIIAWTMLACWLPFVIMIYIDMYGNSLLGGWMTLAIICGNLSYCIKPMIMLGIRGQLVKAIKVILPKSVEDKAGHVSSAVTNTIGRVSNRIFN